MIYKIAKIQDKITSYNLALALLSVSILNLGVILVFDSGENYYKNYNKKYNFEVYAAFSGPSCNLISIFNKNGKKSKYFAFKSENLRIIPEFYESKIGPFCEIIVTKFLFIDFLERFFIIPIISAASFSVFLYDFLLFLSLKF